MTAWQYLIQKGVGATAFAILLSGITAANTWDALVQKSTAPNGSTAWVHLISNLMQVDITPRGGLSFTGGFSKEPAKRKQEEQLLMLVGMMIAQIDSDSG